MPSDKKPVEHLQAKPYNPHDKPNGQRRGERYAQQRSPRQNPQQDPRQNPRPNPRQSAATFFVRQQNAGGRRNPFVGYLLLFLLTALLATAFLFGFVVLLVLFAVLLPIWLVVRFVRGKNVS